MSVRYSRTRSSSSRSTRSFANVSTLRRRPSGGPCRWSIALGRGNPQCSMSPVDISVPSASRPRPWRTRRARVGPRSVARCPAGQGTRPAPDCATSASRLLLVAAHHRHVVGPPQQRLGERLDGLPLLHLVAQHQTKGTDAAGASATADRRRRWQRVAGDQPGQHDTAHADEARQRAPGGTDPSSPPRRRRWLRRRVRRRAPSPPGRRACAPRRRSGGTMRVVGSTESRAGSRSANSSACQACCWLYTSNSTCASGDGLGRHPRAEHLEEPTLDPLVGPHHSTLRLERRRRTPPQGAGVAGAGRRRGHRVEALTHGGGSLVGPSPRRRRLGDGVAVAVRDGHAPILAERLGRDADAGRGLTALVLGPVDESRHARPRARRRGLPAITSATDRSWSDERLEQRVEDVVGGQALVVALVGAQLGRRCLGQDRPRG